MAQPADGTRLGNQGVVAFAIGTGKMQRLDRHFALELRIPGKIYDALGSASEFTANLKATDHLFHGVILACRGVAGVIAASPVAKKRLPPYHSNMEPTDAKDSPEVLQARLVELRTEHRDLDAAISQMTLLPPDDQLLLRRLKKRKLLIKDRISALERLLDPDPDEYA